MAKPQTKFPGTNGRTIEVLMRRIIAGISSGRDTSGFIARLPNETQAQPRLRQAQVVAD